MQRHRIDFQIRAVLVAFRIEQRRRDTPTMEGFRARAGRLLADLEDEVRPYPDLEARLGAARHELAAKAQGPGHEQSTTSPTAQASADR